VVQLERYSRLYLKHLRALACSCKLLVYEALSY
jgi:hypothetical protein